MMTLQTFIIDYWSNILRDFNSDPYCETLVEHHHFPLANLKALTPFQTISRLKCDIIAVSLSNT